MLRHPLCVAAGHQAQFKGQLRFSVPHPLPHPQRLMPMAAVGLGQQLTTLDVTLNPRVAGLKPSKTMFLTDLASSMKNEQGLDVSAPIIILYIIFDGAAL